MQTKLQEKEIKVLLCQIQPRYKKKIQNIKRVQLSLNSYSLQSKIDIVLFPQMSFIGYNFQNKEDALSMAIQYNDQKSQEFVFGRNLAMKLKCYVIFGYMEKFINKQQVVLFNSAAVIDRNGKSILNYRKTHLYYCDYLWSKEGDGFKTLQIINTKGQSFKALLGICMDINPKNFTSGLYQWSNFALQNKVQLLLFLTNWIDHQPQKQQISDMIPMYNYWIERLRPLLDLGKTKTKISCLFLAADRVGKEYSFYDQKYIDFFGGSCAIHLNPNYVIRCLPKCKEGYLMIQSQLTN